MVKFTLNVMFCSSYPINSILPSFFSQHPPTSSSSHLLIFTPSLLLCSLLVLPHPSFDNLSFFNEHFYAFLHGVALKTNKKHLRRRNTSKIKY